MTKYSSETVTIPNSVPPATPVPDPAAAPAAPVIAPNLTIPVLAAPAPAPFAQPVAAPAAAPSVVPLAPAPAVPVVPPAPKTVAEGGTALPEALVTQFGGKFQTIEALAEATAAGERKITELSQQAASVVDPNAQPATPAALSFPPELVASVRADFIANGVFSDASKAALESTGLPPEYIAEYELGLQAQGGIYRAQLLSEFGSVKRYTDMLAWAESTYSDVDAAALDGAINSGDIQAALPHVRGLMARYDQQMGANPHLVEPGAPSDPGGGGPDVYHSQAEMQADQADPRYGLIAVDGKIPIADEAFVRGVEAKMMASINAGTLRMGG